MNLKKLGFLLLLLPTLLCIEARADYYNNSCDPCGYSQCCDPCEGWGIYADYLYWRARRCDLDFAINGEPDATPDSATKMYSVEPSYDSGFRVGITKECGDLFFDFYYTYFCSEDSNSIRGPGLNATRVLSSVDVLFAFDVLFAEEKWDLHLDEVNLLAGYNLCDLSCFQTYVFGGFKYAHLDQKLKTTYVSDGGVTSTFDTVRLKQEIDVDAYGVDLGLGVDYTVCGCWNLFGRFSYDVLLGDYERRYVYQTSDDSAPFVENVNLKDECWQMVSVINLWFGIGYNHLFSGCWCTDLGIAIGYEFHKWLGQPDFLDLISLDEVSVDHHLQSLGFDGLFVRVNLGF